MKNSIFALLVVLLLISCFTQVDARRTIQHKVTGLNHHYNKKPTTQEIFDSFMDGLDIDTMVSNSTNCVHILEQGYIDISESVNHMYIRGWSWENYLDVLSSLGTVTPITRTCFDVTVDAKREFYSYFGSFESFIDFVNQARNNAITHSWDWYTISSAIVTAIQNDRPLEAAFQIGKGLHLMFDFKPTMNSASISQITLDLPDLRPFEDLLKGFLEGSKVFDSENIANCVNNTEFVVQSIDDANTEFSKKTDQGFKNGVFEIADIFEILKPLNLYCYDGTEDVRKILDRIIKNFNSPLDILINAARHVPELTAAGLGAWQAFKNSEFKNLGTELGSIFYYVFITG